MKKSSLTIALVYGLLACCSSLIDAAEPAAPAKLDVLKMREIPTGNYDVSLQLGGENQTLKLAVNGNRASFVKASTAKLDGLSGEFEFIGNGVFFARLDGKNHRASQWWIFNPDGTATVREIPDRGEKQIAKLTSEN